MRNILHCDLNAFFASVECVKNPSLKKVPMAVCGDPAIRHGIILAKNELAKKFGIVTAETIYTAKKKCRNLVLIKENYSDYTKYSKLVNKIYLKYTDKVEPFGIDESFLDITDSTKLFGDAYKIANDIKEEIKNTLGLTISVGISFNKSLAKLGSDIKKPDAITVISYENFKEIINSLPVNMLLYVGRNTYNKLTKMGIYTIGDLSRCNKTKLISKLGKLGEVIFNYANGNDFEPVRRYEDRPIPKSVSRGMTFPSDITQLEELKSKIRILSDEVATVLREEHLKCTTVDLHIKDNNFIVINRQKKVNKTDLFQDIQLEAINILNDNYMQNIPIRAITVGVSNLINKNQDMQLEINDIINQNKEVVKIGNVTKVVDDIRLKYGKNKITFASLLKKSEKNVEIVKKV